MRLVIRYFIFTFFSSIVIFPVLASSEIEKIINLREVEPDKSVPLAELLWKSEADVPVGIELLKSYLKTGKIEQAIEFSKQLIIIKNLTAEQINDIYRVLINKK